MKNRRQKSQIRKFNREQTMGTAYVGILFQEQNKQGGNQGEKKRKSGQVYRTKSYSIAMAL